MAAVASLTAAAREYGRAQKAGSGTEAALPLDGPREERREEKESMNRRSNCLFLRLGWVMVLALAAVWAATAPASAQIAGVTINPTAAVSKPGGATMTVSGTFTIVNCCGSMEIQIFQDQG